ncbi:hypothetical protein Aura_00206 [Pseudomonas phage vB_PpuM-Aura]
MLRMGKAIDYSLPHTTENTVIFKLEIGAIKNGERVQHAERLINLTIDTPGVELEDSFKIAMGDVCDMGEGIAVKCSVQYLIERISRWCDYAVVEFNSLTVVDGFVAPGIRARRNVTRTGSRTFTLNEWAACFLRGQAAYPEYTRYFLASSPQL